MFKVANVVTVVAYVAMMGVTWDIAGSYGKLVQHLWFFFATVMVAGVILLRRDINRGY